MIGERTPLAARLAKIMGEAGRIPKRGQIRSTGGGPSYNFARDPDILDAVIPAMSEAGIMLVPEQARIESVEPTASGKQMIVTLHVQWLVTDGVEEIRFQTFGMGADSGDKAAPKAQTNARKYALLMLLHLATGDDPDEHGSIEQPGRGERAPAAGRRSGSSPAMTPDPVSQLKGQIAEYAREHHLGLDDIQRAADAVGVPKGTTATEEQLRAILGHLSGSGATSDVVAPKEPTIEDVLEASGGELVPPKPGTPEYDALPSGVERASARVYWDARPEEGGEAQE
jgi:hypothetical protein